MRTSTRSHRNVFTPFLLITSASLRLTACGSGAGTVFAATPGDGAHVCADVGKKPYQVRTCG
ncbi:hypothetical protein [Streptomyces sp. NPDC003401]